MRTSEVRKALDEIGKAITDRWQIEQIWNALHENKRGGPLPARQRSVKPDSILRRR
jgi:hypothetical protein